MQPHLLRVRQDGVVVRLGDTRERRVAVRTIAATNRDLQVELAARRFRQDLYHRLCVTSLRLPPLRERAEDIPGIVDPMNTRLAQKYGCTAKAITDEVREGFRRYRWPGNIRELQNVFETLFALCEGDTIDVSQLPTEISNATDQSERPCSLALDFYETLRLDEVEHQAINAAVQYARGNASRAVKILGISRSSPYVKLAAMRHQ
jgi:DNA-binding NtrC family response regulator